MRSIISSRHAKAGFTLTETIVVVTLFTALTLLITQSIFSFYQFNAYTIAQTQQVSEVRDSMEQMVRDIREMTFSDDGTFPLSVMEEDRIGFYSDIDRDDSVEYVEYTLSSTTLSKLIFNATGSPPVYESTPESTTTLSEYIQNRLQDIPVFTYYDNEGLVSTASSTIADIRYVEVTVIVNIDPIRDPGEYMLRSSASLRNLKDVQ